MKAYILSDRKDSRNPLREFADGLDANGIPVSVETHTRHIYVTVRPVSDAQELLFFRAARDNGLLALVTVSAF